MAKPESKKGKKSKSKISQDEIDSWLNPTREDLGKIVKRIAGELSQKSVLFRCPIPGCGSREYVPRFKHNRIFGPEGNAVIEGYKCKKCTVWFSDPVAFSKKK